MGVYRIPWQRKVENLGETPQLQEPEAELPGFGETITPDFLHNIRQQLNREDKVALLTTFQDVHEADIAELITLLSHDHRASFMRLVGSDIPAAVFAELDDGVRDEVVEYIDIDTLVATVQELDSDDAVFVLEDLDTQEQQEVLQKISASDRALLERALEFPEDSAGRLAQSEFVAVPPFWTVGQTIDYLRENEDLPTHFLEIFVVDPRHQPVGVVHLSEVLRTQRPVTMENIIDDDFTVIAATDDREDVARLFERYNLVSAAVVDAERRLLGVITADDVFEVIAEEAGEDILLLGGVGDENVSDSVVEAARGRFSWLFLNLLTAICASLVIGYFDGSIEQMVALAVLMPIVASMGGNAGTQTLTITVRSLATQEISALNAARVVYRELGIGLLNGILFAIVTGAVGMVWFGDTILGVVLAAAMIVNLIVAALAGILIPLGLDRAGIDPAIASSVFVTTVTDVVGFLAFLGFATLFLLN